MIATEKCEEVQRTARELYSRRPDWVTFYREILGLYGTVRRHFPSLEAMEDFERTEAFQEIQRMLRKLREQGPVPETPQEPTKVITVRLPKSMHDTLRVEAHEHHVSMNKLCISKLLQFIDNNRVPQE